MIAYAADTTGARNLKGLRDGGWGILYSSAREQRKRGGGPSRIDRRAQIDPDGTWRFAIDNGAWTCFKQGTPWDEGAFRYAVELAGLSADWVIAPDVVGGGLESLALSRSWLPWLRPRCRRVLVAVQDGMEATEATLDGFDGAAIGGGDAWKFAQLGHYCKPRSREQPKCSCVLGCWPSGAWRNACGSDRWLHVLRVNSQRRLRWCEAAGADSFDGSGPSTWAQHREVMQRALDPINKNVPPLLRLMEK